ncbi:MAG: DUF3826 domain-containing protein [Flavobacteriaceae bacterium]
MLVKKISFALLVCVFAFSSIQAQQHTDPEYIRVTNERAAKIVSELNLNNTEKETAVTNIIGQQYRNLSKIQEERNISIEAVKADNLSEEKQNRTIEKVKAKADKSINKLHKSYLKKLGKQLTETQIEGVKDGMTYGVLPKTYQAFLDMIPSLTQEQKTYIYNNLKEAREHAMDGGSSKEKHAWFGKYKGRINNYLSAQGYDLQKERDGWYQRIEDQKKAE